ncbi:MAG: prolipoprotein diacylglyceryl transferase [Opitutaceae bacterium]|nr:prolipoprotein diacylglyceryl transferase [Opitutaceae bacterium]
MPLAHWVHDWSPFFIRFSDNFGIRYYGLAYLAAFAAGVGLLWLYWKKGRSPFGPNSISDLITVLIVGVLVGGRLGYFLLYQFESVLADPLILIRVWEGGMASHGGFIGVLVAMLWWARRRQVPFFQVADLIVTTAPAGFLLGRCANFINGELVGKASNVAWAVIFPHNEIDRALGQAAVARHPSQLYAAALEGALVLALMQWRFWRTNVHRDQPGRLSGEYLIAYAIARVIGEMFREPDASLLLGLSRGTFYSLFMVAAGAVLIVRAKGPGRAGP